MRITSEIRAIVYGTIPNNPNEYWTIAVGTKQGYKKNDIKQDFVISRIEEFWNEETESFEYDVYLSKNGKPSGDFIWKKYNKRPDFIQYYFEGETWI